jgi:hypothetical protein
MKGIGRHLSYANDCASITGQIKGFALVPKDLPNTFAPVSPSYNCSGQPVEALEGEIGTGIYIVRFSGNPAEIAMATAVDDEPLQDPGVASVKQLAPGEFEVFTASPSEQLAQQTFELLLP